jgi:hypothetical protein
MFFSIKVLLSALVVAGASELAKRSLLAGAILASLPIVSILTIAWLYFDMREPQKIIKLSYSIFWAVLPSLIFFLALPAFLKMQIKFGLSLFLASVVMFISYSAYVIILKKFGIA